MLQAKAFLTNCQNFKFLLIDIKEKILIKYFSQKNIYSQKRNYFSKKKKEFKNKEKKEEKRINKKK